MRLRKVKHAPELIASYPDMIIPNPENFKGNWHKQFKNKNNIELEIGCGKGKFIFEKAKNNPQINYIGIEKYDSVIVRALEKLIEEPLSNLCLIRFDAEYLLDIFAKDEISKIYLNFSDPWPKARQAKRRLTSERFLDRYDKILKESGTIEYKTDNYPFFEYSLEVFKEDPRYSIEITNFDLYKELPEDNIQTEFEMKFVSNGNPIYYSKIMHKGEKHEKTL